MDVRHDLVGSGVNVTVVHDVMPNRVRVIPSDNDGSVDVHIVSDSSPTQECSTGDVSLSNHEVEVVPYVVERGQGVGVKNSFMRNIKTKVKKELRLKDYDYPLFCGRKKKTDTSMDEGGEFDKCNVKDVTDVDTIGVPAKNMVWV
ncbi:hypothetical protein ACSBR2_035219 [Camellia fascicularis]